MLSDRSGHYGIGKIDERRSFNAVSRKQNLSTPADFTIISVAKDDHADHCFGAHADGDYKLTESMMVVEYLEKKYGKPGKSLLPEDAREYGMVCHLHLTSLWMNCMLACILCRMLVHETSFA